VEAAFNSKDFVAAAGAVVTSSTDTKASGWVVAVALR